MAATGRDRIDRLERVVDSLAASVVHHDDEIEKLLCIAREHTVQIHELRDTVAQVVREWQAYLRTRPPQ